MPHLGRPVLDHEASRGLHNEGYTDMEKIQEPVGPPGKLFGKMLGEDRIA
jgi:hypothetical protein